MSIIKAEDITVIETQLENVDKNTLVIFDCDNVLTCINVGAFHPDNRDCFYELVKKNNITQYDLCDKIRLPLVLEENILVNSRMVELVKNLENRAVKHMVLTAYSVRPLKEVKDPVQWRVDTLQSFGYHFEKLWEPSFIELDEFLCNYNPIFKDGVLCCDIFSKSECLKAFLSQIQWKPKKIIFIDDLLRNLVDVEELCVQEKIEYVGIEYMESQNIKPYIPFSESLGQVQVENLMKKSLWISDEEAKKIID